MPLNGPRKKVVATRKPTVHNQNVIFFIASANSVSEIGLLHQPRLVVCPTISSISHGLGKSKNEPEAIFPAKLVSNFGKIDYRVVS